MSGSNIKILISCHKEVVYVQNTIMEPIFIGAAISRQNLFGMLRDDIGENISDKNSSYCELTGQYWAWKNLDADYYGFCHYRRYFNFSKNSYPQDAWGMVLEQRPDKALTDKYGWHEESIQRCLEKAEIITTSLLDIRKFPDRNQSVYQQYASAEHLSIKDMDTILEIIEEKFPDYSQDAQGYINGHKSCFCNMFIMRRDIFFDYCQWLFDILAEFEARADMSHYNRQALRTP